MDANTSAASDLFELLIVLALVFLNGLFALSELAVVSSRHARLKAMVASGRHGAKRALALASDPGRFLSAVQIGITLVGVLNGAYSGEVFGARLADYFQLSGVPPSVASPLAYGGVVLLITYLSVIIGELVPKTLALRNPEAIACAVAPAMTIFSRIAAPAIWALDASTRLVFRLIGQTTESESRVTDEEIKALIAEAETAGVLEKGEREMIAGVMRLADRNVVGIMTPRIDIDWVDLTKPESDIRETLITTPHSRLPVGNGTIDEPLGVVQTRELLATILSGKPFEVRSHVRKAPLVPETMDALDLLRVLREADVPMALILDEHGHLQGLVTPSDVLEAIAGVFKSDTTEEEPQAVERDDGSWLLAGSMPADELADCIGIQLPANRTYSTVAGFMLSHFQRLPKIGEHIVANGWDFEVVDLDGHRIDRVLASRPRPASRRTA